MLSCGDTRIFLEMEVRRLDCRHFITDAESATASEIAVYGAQPPGRSGRLALQNATRCADESWRRGLDYLLRNYLLRER